MISACPVCLDMVTHEDHLMEVACGCGAKFNPFLPSEGDGATSTPASELTPEPGANASPLGDLAFGQMNENPGLAAVPAGNFQESAAAFEELREFGEALIPGAPDPATNVPPPPPPSEAFTPTPPGTNFVAPSAKAGDCLMTAGDVLQGYQVTQYLPPLSVVSDLNLSGGDPLRNAFDAIWNQAKANGANGVVAVKWTITPDGGKVILSGTPVQCVKVS